MKKIFFIILALILVACSPQVTVIPTATLPPPTETPIPTPTLNPDFVAVQNFISDLNENLVLLPDGSIENNGVPIPNLHVAQNGAINIVFNNEHVAIEKPQISFDEQTGLTIDGYELNDNGEWEVAVIMSESDRQIFDAATELDGIKKELNKSWGVVGIDENGEMVKYWDYNEYNYDRGEWKEVVREENGHLVVMDSHGKEQIVYPERITINVNGVEVTYNTTARGYKENATPQTPEEYKAVIEALAREIEAGNILMPFADGAIKLTDLEKWVYYNDNATAKGVYHIRSDKWQKKTPDQIPYSPIAFPYERDGLAVEEAVIVPVMILDGAGNVTGFWGFRMVENKWMKFNKLQEVQSLLDRDMINSGQKSLAVPVVTKTVDACKKAMDNPLLDDVCLELFKETNSLEAEFATSIRTGKMSELLISGTLLPLFNMGRVAK